MAWKLPECWRPYHVAAETVYIAAAAVPMGWLNAVSLFQYLHRQLGLLDPPVGARHPVEMRSPGTDSSG